MTDPRTSTPRTSTPRYSAPRPSAPRATQPTGRNSYPSPRTTTRSDAHYSRPTSSRDTVGTPRSSGDRPAPVGGSVKYSRPTVRSTAQPQPSNAQPSDIRSPTKTPTARDLYDRSGRATPSNRATPSKGSSRTTTTSDSRYKPSKPYASRDVTPSQPRPTAKPRGSVVRDTRSVTDRYAPENGSKPTPTVAPRARGTSATPRLVPRSTTGRNGSIVGGLRGTALRTSRLYGPAFGGVYSSWWDPYCTTSHWHSNHWSLSWGHGCYGGGLSLWYPWYLCGTFSWSGHYRSCWWDTWSSPCASPSRYWWYPTSTYCPTYLYVPSSTVYVEVVDDGPAVASEPAEPEVTDSDAPADLADKYLQLGDFYFKAGRFSEAADAYARARTYAPDDAALHFVLADAAFAVGDYHFAAFLIAEALRLDPSLASASADKREFYGDVKLFDEHMAALDNYLTEKRYDASAHLVRGYNLAFSDRKAAAIGAFKRVLDIAPDHRAARIFLEALEPARSAAEKEAETAKKHG